MNEKVKTTLLIAIPLIFYFVSSYFTTKKYYESSLERYKFCLEQTKEDNMPFIICSHIVHASDSAYSWAASFYQPIVIMLLIIILTLAARVNSINKELKEIKEKLNV